MQHKSFTRIIRFSRVLLLSVLLVILGGLLKPEAAVQPVSFGAKTDFGTGSEPISVAVGDFNGDGKFDLVLTNSLSGSNTVSILLGTGTGSFGAKRDFGTGHTPASVAVADFNGDGKLDLAVANFNSATVSILLGTGTGSFGAKTDFGTDNSPNSVAVGDFNGDGKLDLAIANYGASSVSILLGSGAGSFGAKTDFGTGINPSSVAVGDFNDDGKLDLAVVNNNDATVSILLGSGMGTFAAKTDFGAGNFAFSVAVGDFNGDAKLDLAIANYGAASVSILLGTGTGGFGAKTDFGTGSFPRSVAVGDLNGDGKLDLAVASFGLTSVSILLGTGTGSFGVKTDFGTGAGLASVAVQDFNGDGKLDLATADRDSDAVSILLNTTPIVPSGVFCPGTDFATGSEPYAVAMGDLNGDGKLDLAVARLHGNTISILLGTGTGAFGQRTEFATAAFPESLAVGDFNGDGKLDLAAACEGNNVVSILLGTGTGAFGTKTNFETGNGPVTVVTGDFNGDGKLDLAVANGNNVATVSILLGTGTGAFGARTDFATGSVPAFLALGDFNGDGNLDLVTAGFSTNNVSVLLGTGTGSFGPSTEFGVGVYPQAVAVGDFNGDGNLDVVATNRMSDTVSILLGKGTGLFRPKIDSGTGAGPLSIGVGDFNGDGKLDLAIVDADAVGGSLSVLLGIGTGTFAPKTDYSPGPFLSSVAVGDVNGDGKVDLAVGHDFLVAVLLNNTAPSITAASVTRTAGNPSVNSQIATADDAQDAPNTLSLTVNGGTSATANGVTVTLNPTAPNPSGQFFADVAAACTATTASFTLRVTDGCGLFTEAPLQVTVASPFSLDRDHESFTGNGGNGTVNVSASNAVCAWTASTTATFIHIASGGPGIGNGAVQYSVDANPGPNIRSDTIMIAGHTFTVYQGINFLDVPANDPFYADIGKLAARGVTLGCGNANYCPNDPVTREQMAAFIMRAKGEFNPPLPASQRFNDVPPQNVFYNFIDRLAVLQITLGCTPDHLFYCPSDPVKREQMAAFLLRGLGEFSPPTPPSQRFNDVPPSNVFYNFIDRMAVLNITLGCTPDHLMYCPNDSVTRAQMAAFLVRAFNL